MYKRQVAINEVGKSNSTAQGLTYLKSTFQKNNEYWYKKPIMIELLNFISRIEYIGHMEPVSYTHLDVYKRQKIIRYKICKRLYR